MHESKHIPTENIPTPPETAGDEDLKIKARQLSLDQNFTDLFAVSVLVLSPKRDSLLVEYRRHDELYAIISGKGALSDDPSKPVEAALKEITWDTGVTNLFPTELFVSLNETRQRTGVYVVTAKNLKSVIILPHGHGADRTWVPMDTIKHTQLAFDHNEIINTLCQILTL